MEVKDKEKFQAQLQHTMDMMDYQLTNHNIIVVGVSGGSDSNIIVHMICTYFREYLPKIHFVFSNTGLEYRATKRHLDYMEQRYNIKIDRIKPRKGNNVIQVVRREGLPLVSKEFSYILYYALQGSEWAIKKINQTRAENKHYAFSKKLKALADYLLENQIKTSAKCCDLSKKSPFKSYLRKTKADLKISGERQVEGGIRAFAHKSCFETGHVSKDGKKHIDKYMPLFLWGDELKQWYKEQEGIVYSDCYEIWGMERTGCVGCPFNSKAGEDLEKIKKYEPNMYRACMNVFGRAYKIMDKFDIRKKRILTEEEYKNIQ